MNSNTHMNQNQIKIVIKSINALIPSPKFDRKHMK